jgi:hypothetical protein
VIAQPREFAPASDCSNEFGYVDTAVGGAKQRNKVKRFDEFCPPLGAVDAYATWMRYDAALLEHVTESGSVSSYRGPCWAPRAPLDFDSKADPAVTLEESRRVVCWLRDRFEVDPKAIRIHFSGHKGFHLEVPAALFGGFAPSADLPARVACLVRTLVEGLDLKTLDWGIYNHLRLWRVPNSKHSATELYKIPLTVGELLSLDIAAIRELARQPREVEHPADDDWFPVAELEALWHGVQTEPNAYSRSSGSGADRIDMGAVLAGVPEGARNDTLFRAVCKLRGADVPYEFARDLTLKAAANCTPPFPEHEALAVVENVYRRYAPGSSYFTHSSAHTESENAAPPAFPVDALPRPLRDLVTEGAAALGCPPDYIALPALAFAGAVIGRTRAIRLKRDYIQRPILTVCVVGPPGATKTPAIQLARAPLDVLQRRAIEENQRAIIRYEEEIRLWEKARKERDNPGPPPEKPALEHFYTTDATMEAIASMLDSSAGVALVRDELVGWVASFDAYRNGRGADRQNFLTLWSGATLKVDRKGKPPIYVQDPVLCVVGGTQPDCLPLLSDEASRRDGFIERICWAWPQTAPAQWTDVEVSETTRAAMLATFEQLRRGDTEALIDLSAKARGLWVESYNSTTAQGRAADGLLAGILAKLPNQVARIALILHVLDDPTQAAERRVSPFTMEAAIAIGDYLIAHARRVLPQLVRKGRVEREPVEWRIWRHLDAAGGWVSKTDLVRKFQTEARAADLDAALTSLERNGIAEHRTVETASRSRTEWRCLEPCNQ